MLACRSLVAISRNEASVRRDVTAELAASARGVVEPFSGSFRVSDPATDTTGGRYIELPLT
jgi:hypothetical protein